MVGEGGWGPSRVRVRDTELVGSASGLGGEGWRGAWQVGRAVPGCSPTPPQAQRASETWPPPSCGAAGTCAAPPSQARHCSQTVSLTQGAKAASLTPALPPLTRLNPPHASASVTAPSRKEPDENSSAALLVSVGCRTATMRLRLPKRVLLPRPFCSPEVPAQSSGGHESPTQWAVSQDTCSPSRVAGDQRSGPHPDQRS